jgi:hypothetical protein
MKAIRKERIKFKVKKLANKLAGVCLIGGLVVVSQPVLAQAKYAQDSVRGDSGLDDGKNKRAAILVNKEKLSLLNKVVLIDSTQMFNTGGHPQGVSTGPWVPDTRHTWVVYGKFRNDSRYPITISLVPMSEAQADALSFKAMGIVDGELINASRFEVAGKSTYGWAVYGPYMVSAYVLGVFEPDFGIGGPKAATENSTGLPLPIYRPAAWNATNNDNCKTVFQRGMDLNGEVLQAFNSKGLINANATVVGPLSTCLK